MRVLILAAALILSGCSASAVAGAGQTGAEVVRIDRSGDVSLMAGSIEEGASYSFNVWYENAGAQLGEPTGVGWSIRFGDYCRDRFSFVQSVLLGPQGQVWRGYRVPVPAGPVRAQDWSSGSDGAEAYGGPPTPGLLEAMTEGGRFTLALEDDEGQRWNAVEIDTLSSTERERLYQTFIAANPDPAADASDGMLVVEVLPPGPSGPPRACP